ncbi:hypothetical protein ASG32_03025 [Methylobacterium sp. Leaf361]|uniref:hypothetical protein n=1 Tax=Methylobacterium sp. Leaf361 TaxID=1736352 RepID=UPI0006FD6A17|nr:hypothetical protein [Methylobacterium sp. Leaf361]KQS81738.1 hypothetical protein ASG32_03025 [Methylobacterium sp. Leaf361]
MTSPAPDTGRTAEDEMEAEIGFAFARYLSASDLDVSLRRRVKAAVEPILEDLIAARKERDEALVRSTEDEIASSWDQAISDLTKGMLAKSEANLITLAKMYGEACRELAKARLDAHQQRLVVDACQQVAGKALGYPWFKDDQKNFPGSTEEHGVCIGEHVEETIVEELAKAYAHLRAENANLRDRVREAEKALKPFADVCDADHMRYVKDEQVLELSTRAEVPVSEKLRGRDFRAARFALVAKAAPLPDSDTGGFRD